LRWFATRWQTAVASNPPGESHAALPEDALIDHQAYERDGYLLLGRVLSAAEVRTLIDEERRFRRRDGRLVVITQLMHRSEPIRRVATTGAHIAALRSLMGNDICLTHQQFVTKAPHPDTPEIDVPWHQDNGYGELDPKTDVTVWFALNDCDERTGCLWVIPGSHQWPLAEHHPEGGLRGIKVTAAGIPLPMRAGEAVAFSGMLVHCSKANHGPTRHAFYLRYCHPATRMLSHGGKPVLDDGHSWMVSGEAP
jgi:ectoine hydroxylase-related dioxygenase (phytanoyl-CoA dioxygenase family)